MTPGLTPNLCKDLRHERGYSIRLLAVKANIREEHLRLYEAERYDLGPYSLQRLAEALGAAETSEEAANVL